MIYKHLYDVLKTSNIEIFEDPFSFYQKRGFDLKEIHRNAVEAARKIKPSIPLFSEDGVPIKHEIEFEKLLEHTEV